MDKLAKSIVRALHTTDPHEDITCAYPGSFAYRGTFTLDELAERIGASVTKTKLAIRYLNEIGYIDEILCGSNASNQYVAGFRLSNRGNHCREIRREDLRKALFRGVFLPVVVSFVTTVVTLTLSELWPQMLQWLTSTL